MGLRGERSGGRGGLGEIGGRGEGGVGGDYVSFLPYFQGHAADQSFILLLGLLLSLLLSSGQVKDRYSDHSQKTP